MKKNKLHTIKSSGFKTPAHYFESFEANFLERLNEKEMINSTETTGFDVPKNYFETVESNVFAKLQTNTEKPVIVLKSKSTFYYIAGIAASMVLLFSLVFNNKDTITFNSLDTASIESYLYLEEYSNEDFASLLKFEDISVTDFIDVNISDETLDQYLENMDTEDLILDQ